MTTDFENKQILSETDLMDVQEATGIEDFLAQINSISEQYSEITITDFEDEEQIEKVKKAWKELQQGRIALTKGFKNAREEAKTYSDYVRSEEKRIVSIITPQEERLKGLLEEVKKQKTRDERMAVLPMRKATLATIKDGIEVSDEEILDMDDNDFNAYYGQRMAEFNAQIAIKAQAEQAENDKKEAEEKAKKEELIRIENELKEKEAEADRKAMQVRQEMFINAGLIWNETEQAHIHNKYSELKITSLDFASTSDIELGQLVAELKNKVSQKDEEVRVKKEADEAQAKIIAEQKAQDEENARNKANERYQTWITENMGENTDDTQFTIKKVSDVEYQIIKTTIVSTFNK